MISGQPVLQSTMIRNYCPPYDAKHGLGNGGILSQNFNVPINARPIDSEADLCLKSGDTLVSFVESTEHCNSCTKTMRDVEVTTVYNQIVIDAKVVFDAQNFSIGSFREAF